MSTIPALDLHTPDWSLRFAESTRQNKGSAIRDLLSVIGSQTISFAGGLPAPEVFAVEEAAVAADDILATEGRSALQYGPTEGYRPLREALIAQWQARGVNIGVENILITSGAQQGLDLIGRIFLEPHDRVMVESPTYVGAMSAWFGCLPHYLTLPMDHDGLIVESVDDLTERHGSAKFAYSVVNFQNPTGVTLARDRREALIETAHRLDMALIEDDPYRALRYTGQDIPGLIEIEGQMLGSEWNHRGRVIHLGTFSKTLMPGLRVGYAIAPAPVIRAMVIAKQGFDLHTSMLNQMIVERLITEKTIERNLPNLISLYHRRRDVMDAALNEHFAGRAEWAVPDGGLFLWVKLPAGMNTESLLPVALENQVAYVPGNGFFAVEKQPNTLRLNFSNQPEDRIKEGIRRLASILR
ncbi:MAG: aminotransferase [Chloroflexi bacterium]|nr:aminotransferase [Chloroflexota bacterium]